MSVSINCCPGMNIKKIFCNCWRPQNKEEKSEQVIYRDFGSQIVVFSTTNLDFNELMSFKDIHLTDTYMFSADNDGTLRFVSMNGPNHYFIQQPNVDLVPKSPQSSVRENINIYDYIGKPLQSILPEFIINFLVPIFIHTLQGRYMQVAIWWIEKAYIIRTFPFYDSKKNIIAGTMIMSPYRNNIEDNINKFVVKEPSTESKKGGRRHKNKTQSKSEVGMLPSSIIPNKRVFVKNIASKSSFSLVPQRMEHDETPSTSDI